MKPSLTDKAKADLVGRQKVIRTKWRFWASEASCKMPDGKIIGNCMRRMFYQWSEENVTDPVSEWVKNLGEIGNYLEEKTRNEFKKKGIYVEEDNKKSKRKFRVEIFKDAELSAEVDIM